VLYVDVNNRPNDGFLRLSILPRPDALFQRGIVERRRRAQLAVEEFALCFCRRNPVLEVLEGESHLLPVCAQAPIKPIGRSTLKLPVLSV